MHSLLLEELVSCEGVEGEEATNIPDVGLEDGDIASLEEDRREKGVLDSSLQKNDDIAKKRKEVSSPFVLQLTRECQFFWLIRMRGGEKWSLSLVGKHC